MLSFLIHHGGKISPGRSFQIKRTGGVRCIFLKECQRGTKILFYGHDSKFFHPCFGSPAPPTRGNSINHAFLIWCYKLNAALVFKNIAAIICSLFVACLLIFKFTLAGGEFACAGVSRERCSKISACGEDQIILYNLVMYNVTPFIPSLRPVMFIFPLLILYVVIEVSVFKNYIRILDTSVTDYVRVPGVKRSDSCDGQKSAGKVTKITSRFVLFSHRPKCKYFCVG